MLPIMEDMMPARMHDGFSQSSQGYLEQEGYSSNEDVFNLEEINCDMYDFVNKCRNLASVSHSTTTSNCINDTLHNDNNVDSVDKSYENDLSSLAELFQKAAEACFNGNVDAVKLFIAQDPNIDYLGSGDRTLLLIATSQGHYDIVQLLLGHGSNIHFRDVRGWTPIMIAVCKKFDKIVELLLHKGANANETITHALAPNRGKPVVASVLHFACRLGNISLANLLIENGADVFLDDSAGHTVLHYAVVSKSLNIVKLVISKGINVHAIDRDHRTALHCAAMYADYEIIELLISLNLNALQPDIYDLSPVILANLKGKTETYKKMIKLCNISDENSLNCTTSLDESQLRMLEKLKVGLNEPKLDKLARVIKRCPKANVLAAYFEATTCGAQYVINSKGDKKEKSLGGKFFNQIKNLMDDGVINGDDWYYINQLDKEKVLRNIRSSNLTDNSDKIKSNNIRTNRGLSQRENVNQCNNKINGSNKFNGGNKMYASNKINGGNKMYASNKINGGNKMYASNKINGGNKMYASNKINGNNKMYASNKINGSNKMYASNKINGNHKIRGYDKSVNASTNRIWQGKKDDACKNVDSFYKPKQMTCSSSII